MSEHDLKRTTFSDAFDAVYVLSDPITRRQTDCAARLAKLGITEPLFQHAKANPSLSINNMRRNPPIEFAVNLGHLKNITTAIADQSEQPLFLEDDVHFADNADDVLRRALCQLPAVWSVLYLGGHPREKIDRYSDHLVTANAWSCAEAYAINPIYLFGFVNFWCDRISKPNAMFDFILGEFAAWTGCAFAVHPSITYQPDGWSFIGTKTDSKTDLVARGWANNLEADQ